MSDKEHNILFGSGELFIVPNDIDLEEATDEDIEEAMTLIGESSGEASLLLENEFVDVPGGKSHGILASFKTSETIMFNAGIVTLNLENLSQVLAGDFTETATAKTLKLGGDYRVPINRLRFVHTKKVDGNRLIVDMHKALNKAGLELSFNAEEASVFNLEFTLMQAKGKDNIVTITEEIGEVIE